MTVVTIAYGMFVARVFFWGALAYISNVKTGA
jgi:hypothetical protein